MKYISHILFFLLFCSGLPTLQAQEQIGGDIILNDTAYALGNNVQISDDGTRVLVSGYGNSLQGFSVYDLVGGAWTPQPAFAETEFPKQASSYSVAMSSDGTKIVVGAVVNDIENNFGKVRVYHYNTGNWSLIGEAIAGNSDSELFGHSVGISDNGNRIIVGARLNSERSDYGGRVAVFQFTNGSWSQMGESIYGETEGEKEGSAVAISGDGRRIVMGSNAFGEPFRVNFGKMQIYEWSANTWELKMTKSGALRDHFGYSVAVSSDGSKFAAGATQMSFSDGYVKVYRGRTAAFEEIGGIRGANNQNLGSSVALSADGNRIAIGAARANSVIDSSGFVVLYDFKGGKYDYLGIIEGLPLFSKFGKSVDISGDGNFLAVSSLDYQYGVPGSENGVVRVYDISNFNSQNPESGGEGSAIPIVLYPTPASTSIFCANCEGVTELDVFDVSGKLLLSFNGPLPETLDISILQTGIYYVYLYKNETDPEVKKILKQ